MGRGARGAFSFASAPGADGAGAAAPAIGGGLAGQPPAEGGCIARVLSVCVGRVVERLAPAAFLAAGEAARPYRTGIAKAAAFGPVRVTVAGLVGDRQADTRNHGGADKAVHAHFVAHLRAWGAERGAALRHGEIGENLTLGAAEDGPEPDEGALCIGDVVGVGTAVLQVTQPRIPCFKQAHQIGLRDAVARAVATGRTGLYLRVLQEGDVRAGDAVRLLRRPHPGATVAEVNRVLHRDRDDAGSRTRLAALPELAEAVRRELVRGRG